MHTFGLDPEFMLVSRGQLKSAIGVLPKKIKAKHFEGNYFYYDNVLAEIAVKPAYSKENTIYNVEKALKGLVKIIHPIKFDLCAADNYPKKELNSFDARLAGCNPEWNVYTLQCILPPKDIISETSFRTAGGHIHLGSKSLQEPDMVFKAVRMLDLFVGIPSILLDRDPTSKKRRKIYGQAGSHRITKYGLEYRCLGNFWLSSPEHVGFIYDLCCFILEFIEGSGYDKFWYTNELLLEKENPSEAYSCYGYDVAALIKCINYCDIVVAKKFMNFLSHYLPKCLLISFEELMERKKTDPYCSWHL